MPDNNPFSQLIERARAGDEQAAAELFERYEGKIRRVVRFNLGNGLRRYLDSEDLRQSVFASFFLRARLGQFDVHSPEQLLHLLAEMTRNKITNKVKYLTRSRRDCNRTDGQASAGLEEALADSSPSPSRLAINREMWNRAQQRLQILEPQLFDLRGIQEKPWLDIAAQLGGTADALRKRWDRIVDQVAEELGLEEQ